MTAPAAFPIVPNARTCYRCGGEYDAPPPRGEFGAAGYATLRENGENVCYPCADAMQRAELAALPIGGRYSGYLSEIERGNGRGLVTRVHVTTWTGGILATGIAWRTRSGFGRERWYFHAHTPEGLALSGNSPAAGGMYCRIRRVKKHADCRHATCSDRKGTK